MPGWRTTFLFYLYFNIMDLQEAFNAPNIPSRAVNGGLYTGEPFAQGAQYANVPVIPDAGYMIHFNLRSANPPEDALYHYPGGLRPGNNTAIFPGVQPLADGRFGIACNNAPCKSKVNTCTCNKCSFKKYAYLWDQERSLQVIYSLVVFESFSWHLHLVFMTPFDRFCQLVF